MTARQEIDLIAAIADMKTVDYRNTLALATLIDLLVQKGLFTREEFAQRAQQLETTGD
ncbi:MAG TPA: hypothetical protein VGK74_21110 [Symbiobacteriaceae bacterium]|jgi:hypothetical protein